MRICQASRLKTDAYRPKSVTLSFIICENEMFAREDFCH